MLRKLISLSINGELLFFVDIATGGIKVDQELLVLPLSLSS